MSGVGYVDTDPRKNTDDTDAGRMDGRMGRRPLTGPAGTAGDGHQMQCPFFPRSSRAFTFRLFGSLLI